MINGLAYDVIKSVFSKLNCNSFIVSPREMVIVSANSDQTRTPIFPAIIAFVPIATKFENGEHPEVIIPKVVIANSCNEFESTETKYSESGNFKNILSELTNSFFVELCKNKNVVNKDYESLSYEMVEIPSIQTELFANYFYDSVEIRNLNFKIIKTKKC